MRAIKFRAWQTVTKVMFYNIERGTGETGGTPPFADYLENKHMVVMQFTGLHDKAGREIYEGDIVKCGEGYVEGNIPHDWKFKGICSQETVEVIGNVYEQPKVVNN